jgi:predicted RNase H-like HicB family nuclease
MAEAANGRLGHNILASIQRDRRVVIEQVWQQGSVEGYVGMRHAYIEAAMSRAVCEYLDEDGLFFWHVRELQGAWAAAESEAASLAELAEVLEDWITLGREHGDHIPVLDGIDLNAAHIV